MLGLRTNLSRRGFFKLGFAGSLATIWPPRLFRRRTSGLTNDVRPRLRDLGIVIGRLPTGSHNDITDVNGVLVGHTTKISGSGKLEVGVGPVRTGVTAILPRSGNEYSEPLNAGRFILNGNGELTGAARMRSSGALETPIFLTGTANVGIVYDAALTYLLNKHPEIGRTSHVPTPVVGECWDSLGDIQGRHLTEGDVMQAIQSAAAGPFEEGAVGGGTGMRSYGFKSGTR